MTALDSTLEAPATTNTTEPDIMALAVQADAEQAQAESQTATAAPTEKSSPPADSGADAIKPAQPPTENAATDPKPAKPETPYKKAQQEAERRDRSWKALEAEKAAVRAEAERTRQTSHELETLRREVQALRTPKPAAEAAGATPEIYEQLAENYEAEGNSQMAALARKTAQDLRQAPNRAPAAAAQTEAWRSPDFQKEWQRHTAEVIAADPAINDPENPVFKATNMLVNHPQWGGLFRSNPTGIKAAVEVARLMRQAESAATLHKHVETARAEIKRLTQLNSPRAGGPAARLAGNKKLADMTDAEADDYVRAVAAAADRGELT